MRNLLLLGAAFGLATTASAQNTASTSATGDGNTETVNQTGSPTGSTNDASSVIVGDNNIVDIDQTGSANDASSDITGDNNSATIDAFGDRQTADIKQSGDTNTALAQLGTWGGTDQFGVSDIDVEISQVGDRNYALTGLDGIDVDATIDQGGDDNDARVYSGYQVTDEDLVTTITQTGDRNRALATSGNGFSQTIGFTQTGNDNRAEADYEGDSNSLTLLQAGDNNIFSSTTRGDDNTVMATQSGDGNSIGDYVIPGNGIAISGNMNTVSLNQSLGGNSATVSIVGDSNAALLDQAEGSLADILQSGNENLVVGVGSDLVGGTLLQGVSTGSTLDVDQIGNGNVLFLDQTNGGTATVMQDGSTNTSTVVQN